MMILGWYQWIEVTNELELTLVDSKHIEYQSQCIIQSFNISCIYFGQKVNEI
jgi:hypothetical protein